MIIFKNFGIILNTENGNNIYIKNNILNYTNRDAIWVTASNVLIENNKIYNSHDNSIVFDSSFNTENSSFENYKIVNNTVYYSHGINEEINLSNLQYIPASAQVGIFLYGKTENDLKNIIISNNIIYSSFNTITLINLQNIQINNNIMCNYTNQSAQGNGVSSNTINKLIFTNNHILGSRSSGLTFTTSSDILIEDNIINANNYVINGGSCAIILKNNILKNTNASFVCINNIDENSHIENNIITSSYTNNYISSNIVNSKNNTFNNNLQRFIPYIKNTENSSSAVQVNLNYDVNIINSSASINNLVIGGTTKNQVVTIINNTSENTIHVIKGSGTYKGILDEYIGTNKSLILTFNKYSFNDYALTSVINETTT